MRYLLDRQNDKRWTRLARLGDSAEPEVSQDYFLPALFAAQKAFNLADNFALAAGLIFLFLAGAARLPESVDGLAPCTFAHLAF